MSRISRLFTRASVTRWALGAGLALGLSTFAMPLAAQTGTVEGRVTRASNGRPIVGAQVSVEGTNLGTTTGEDGRYVLLNVPTGAMQIRVAAIGFTIGTVQLNVQSGAVNTADAALSASVLRLDEVVVTGTAGAARKREIGNTIAQINVADVADPPASVDQLLQARAAGVNVMQTGGSVGSGAQIRLRGAVSVSQSNQPLLYVDGVRVRSGGFRRNRPPVGFTGRSGNVEASPLNNINPNDIERIEVIKGAAASTLYGTEAAAGVIQIFTKRGRLGTPQYTLQVDQGFARTQAFGTDENPFVNMKPCSTGPTCWEGWTSDQVVGSCGSDAPTLDVNCSWLRDGHRQKYAGSVGGGNGPVSYFVSGSYNNYDGTLPKDNESAFTARGNFSFEVSNNIRVDVNSSYTRREVSNTAAGNNAHGVTLNVFRANRNYFGDNDPNNLRQILNQDIDTDFDHLITGGTITYNPTPWFSNRFTLGYDFANQENRNLRPFGYVQATGGILSDEQIKYTTLTADYVGNVNLTLSDALRSTFSFGGQTVTDETIRTSAYGEDFPGPGVPTVSSASQFVANESRIRTINAGFFLQNLFALQDRYFLTVGARFDGNSAFGSSLGIEAYPKASLSYVISDEDFFPQSLGTMKLRGAFGYSGRAPDAFDAIRTWNPIPYTGQPGFTPSNVGNSDVGPERTREIEVGVDWAMFDDRLSTEFTYYEQKTSDALFGVTQIPSQGFLASQATNAGTIRNRGIELSLNASVIDQPNLGLDIGSNFYTNNSLVLDLGEAVPFGAGGGWVEEGLPVMVLTGLRFGNRDVVAEPDTACGPTCAANNQFPYGPQQPTFVWTPTMNLRLPGGVAISARGELQTGAFIDMGVAGNALSRSVLWPQCSNAYTILDGGTADQLTAWERIACIPANHDFGAHVYKQDFFKLRDLTARIPIDFLTPPQIESALLTISAQNFYKNLFDLPMFDPEMTSRDSIGEQNRSISEHIPAPAVFTASIRVTF